MWGYGAKELSAVAEGTREPASRSQALHQPLRAAQLSACCHHTGTAAEAEPVLSQHKQQRAHDGLTLGEATPGVSREEEEVPEERVSVKLLLHTQAPLQIGRARALPRQPGGGVWGKVRSNLVQQH
jgi:hypothetical protein